MKTKKKSLKTETTPSPAGQPSGEEIALYAYTLWELEGRPQGREIDHWLHAETQLRGGRQQAENRA